MTGGPGPCLNGMELKLIDANLRLYPQRVHERSFAAFEASGMVLLLKNKMNLELSSEDQIINDFNQLQQVHRTAVSIYQLFPRRCRLTRALEVMSSICFQPGSPFTLADRVDPVDTKLILRSKEMDTLNEYNEQNAWKYQMCSTIYFEGILSSTKNKAVAFVMTNNALTPMNAYWPHQYIDFLRFWVTKAHPDNKTVAQRFETLLKTCNDKPMIVSAADTAPTPELLKKCTDRGVYVMKRLAANSMKFAFIR
ncbi:DNA-directed RNA polymerase-like protein [Perkinsela sp. CCAP 1560/4]|nr:DNA-directed RNA polymerase-like protein [Perkinsela sp. CCAP 1560/4]|eukprot:KNH09796.1 DNA-directed RNA polymerase-like protein [Perkinsela sp. CCAP 1560/4]